MKTEKANIHNAVHMLKILSHPVRLLILCHLLHRGEMSVGEIVAAQKGGASQSHISQFLAKMRAEGIVAFRKNAQTVYYRIKSAQIKKIVQALYVLFCK